MWMNSCAVGSAPYKPTNIEHLANIITHGAFVIPSICAAKSLVDSSNSDIEYSVSMVYGFALVGLFAVSTVFHACFFSGYFKCLKEVLHRADRAMIYVFIASAYTPWLILKSIPIESWAVHLRWGIWVLAIIGIIYQQIFHEKFKMVETIFYVIIGVVPSLSVVEMEDSSGLTELQVGGIIYIVGVIFFKMDGRIPMAHAIWHLFVVLASFIHYHAVLNHLILKNNSLESSFPLSHGKEIPIGSIDSGVCHSGL